MKIGIIDLGTNSARFAIYTPYSLNRRKRLFRKKVMLRLGDRVFRNGKLDRAVFRQTVKALRRFSKMAADFKVDTIRAVATSALREAKESERLLKRIKESTGIQVEIISGTEEAQLIALGVLTYERALPKTFCLVDIGGGSTEISLCHNRKIIFSRSIRVGASRIQHQFLCTSPPKTDGTFSSVNKARHNIRRLLRTSLGKHPSIPRHTIIGSGGTIKSLYRLAKKARYGRSLTVETLARMVDDFSHLSIRELLRVPGMEPKRADMILAGALALQECMNFLGARRVIASKFSLRDGLLVDELDRIRLTKVPATFQA